MTSEISNADAVRGDDNQWPLLVHSADLMRHYAQKYCSHNFFSKDPMSSIENKSSCEWYHAFWQYKRLLGLAISPNWHAGFYTRFFADTRSTDPCNILISGTADYAILDHLAKCVPHSLRNNTVIWILDACQTPIEICKWYIKWYKANFNINLNVRYVIGDALHTGFADHTFDMITTYSFLSRFEANEKEKLVGEWRRILKPGGYIISSDYMSPEYKTDEIVTTQAQIDYYVEQTVKLLDKRTPWLRSKKKTITSLAYEYARNHVRYSIPSEESLHQLFNGLDITTEYSTHHCALHGLERYVLFMCNNSLQRE